MAVSLIFQIPFELMAMQNNLGKVSKFIADIIVTNHSKVNLLMRLKALVVLFLRKDMALI
jgi:hypothetical protein